MLQAATIWLLIAGVAMAAAQDSTPSAASTAVRPGTMRALPASQADRDADGGAPYAEGSSAIDRAAPSFALPNAPSYVPLSGQQKFQVFARSTYAPYTFFSAAVGATLAQAEGQWYEYGGGMQGWSKRFGATLADTESRRFIQSFALATVLHQDPRYFHSGKKGLFPRAWYAATRVFVIRADTGQSEFNSSEMLGALLTSSLQNAYYPKDERSFGDTLVRFGGAYGSDATTYLLREFWPDMRRLFKKHAPKKIQEIEQKIPEPVSRVMFPQ